MSTARALGLAALLSALAVLLAPLAVIVPAGRRIAESPDDLPGSYTCLLLGAGVYSSGRPSPVLEERLLAGLRLYRLGKVKRFLLTGDHGSRHYDEVNGMRKYLSERGVPEEDLFTDHAGFSTWESVVRAREVFLVTDVTIVTQRFHLPRALFLARAVGLEARGFAADGKGHPGRALAWWREYPALIKALFDALVQPPPRFTGPPIPVTGDSAASRG